MDKRELQNLTKALIQIQKGNINALDTVYSLTRKGVFSFVLPIVHSYDRAEDIMQNTYIKLFENIDQFDSKKNPLNWILTIAKNLAVTEITRDNKEMSTDFSEQLNDNLVFTMDSKEFETPLIDLANKILNPDELQVVMMYVIAEYKHREIAELLNIPIGTVTWRYNSAIKKLRQEAEKLGYGK